MSMSNIQPDYFAADVSTRSENPSEEKPMFESDEHFDAIAKQCIDLPPEQIDDRLIEMMEKRGLLPAYSSYKWKSVKTRSKTRRRDIESLEILPSSAPKSELPWKNPLVSQCVVEIARDKNNLAYSAKPQVSDIDKTPLVCDDVKESNKMSEFDKETLVYDDTKESKNMSEFDCESDPRPLYDSNTPIIDPFDKSTLRLYTEDDLPDTRSCPSGVNKCKRCAQEDALNKKLSLAHENYEQIIQSLETSSIQTSRGANLISKISNKTLVPGKSQKEMNKPLIIQSRKLSGKDTKNTENYQGNISETIPLVQPQKYLYTVPYIKEHWEKVGKLKSKKYLRRGKKPSCIMPSKPVPILKAQEIFYTTPIKDIQKRTSSLKKERITRRKAKYYDSVFAKPSSANKQPTVVLLPTEVKRSSDNKMDQHPKPLFETLVVSQDPSKLAAKTFNPFDCTSYYNRDIPVHSGMTMEKGTINSGNLEIPSQTRAPLINTIEPREDLGLIMSCSANNPDQTKDETSQSPNQTPNQLKSSDPRLKNNVQNTNSARKADRFVPVHKQMAGQPALRGDARKQPMSQPGQLRIPFMQAFHVNHPSSSDVAGQVRLVSEIIQIIRERNTLYDKHMELHNKALQRTIIQNLTKQRKKPQDQTKSQASEKLMDLYYKQMQQYLEEGANSNAINFKPTSSKSKPKIKAKVLREITEPDVSCKTKPQLNSKLYNQHTYNASKSKTMKANKPYQRKRTSRPIYKPMITIDNSAVEAETLESDMAMAPQHEIFLYKIYHTPQTVPISHTSPKQDIPICEPVDKLDGSDIKNIQIQKNEFIEQPIRAHNELNKTQPENVTTTDFYKTESIEEVMDRNRQTRFKQLSSAARKARIISEISNQSAQSSTTPATVLGQATKLSSESTMFARPETKPTLTERYDFVNNETAQHLNTAIFTENKIETQRSEGVASNLPNINSKAANTQFIEKAGKFPEDLFSGATSVTEQKTIKSNETSEATKVSNIPEEITAPDSRFLNSTTTKTSPKDTIPTSLPHDSGYLEKIKTNEIPLAKNLQQLHQLTSEKEKQPDLHTEPVSNIDRSEEKNITKEFQPQSLLEQIYQNITSKGPQDKTPPIEAKHLVSRKHTRYPAVHSDIPGFLKQLQNTLYALAGTRSKDTTSASRKIKSSLGKFDPKSPPKKGTPKKPNSTNMSNQMHTQCIFPTINGPTDTDFKNSINDYKFISEPLSKVENLSQNKSENTPETNLSPTTPILPDLKSKKEVQLSELLKRVRARNQLENYKLYITRERFKSHLLASKVIPKCPDGPCGPQKPPLPTPPCPNKSPCPASCPPPYCPPPRCPPPPKRPPCGRPCGPCPAPRPCPPHPCGCPPPSKCPAPSKCPQPPICPPRPCPPPPCPGDACPSNRPKKPPFRRPKLPPPPCPTCCTPMLKDPPRTPYCPKPDPCEKPPKGPPPPCYPPPPVPECPPCLPKPCPAPCEQRSPSPPPPAMPCPPPPPTPTCIPPLPPIPCKPPTSKSNPCKKPVTPPNPCKPATKPDPCKPTPPPDPCKTDTKPDPCKSKSDPCNPKPDPCEPANPKPKPCKLTPSDPCKKFGAISSETIFKNVSILLDTKPPLLLQISSHHRLATINGYPLILKRLRSEPSVLDRCVNDFEAVFGREYAYHVPLAASDK